MLTPGLEQKCVQLEEKDKEFRKFRKPARISGMICGLSLLSFIIASQPENIRALGSEVNYIPLIVAAITLAIGIFYRKKGRPYEIKGNALVTLYCYKAYTLLQNYQKTKIASRLKKAKNEMNSALYQITSQWKTVEDNSIPFGKITEPLGEFIDNLKERFLPSIDKEELAEKNFQTIENLIPFLLEDPNFDFSKINSVLTSYPQTNKGELKILKTERQKKVVRMIGLWGAFIVIGGFVTYISRIAGADVQTQIMVWVTVSVAAVTICYTSFKKRLKI